MEEADLLKERLQAIMDKRKIQEDIAKKKRDIEEEKLKLQYLKKKALREQWLMDGLSPQSVQEDEAMKLQAQDDQQQTQILENKIYRMEKEIENLEGQEMMISAKEVLVLKRLKEVEKTTEDIIKAVNADVQPEPIQYIYSAIPDIPKSYKPSQLKKRSSPVFEPNSEQSKQALFAMKINVQKDIRTGESHVLSTANVTPQELSQKGFKVYDDGRKSVYALRTDGQIAENKAGELTPLEVEELLRKATEKKSQANVEYHEPVFSSPYSRPSTPKRLEPELISPGPRGPHEIHSSCTAVQPGGFNTVTPSLQGEESFLLSSIPCHHSSKHFEHPHHKTARNAQNSVTKDCELYVNANTPKSVQIPFHKSFGNTRPELHVDGEHKNPSPVYLENSNLNIRNAMPHDMNSTEPVTMIFMGYQNAGDEDEDQLAFGEDAMIQAELVVISDDEESSRDLVLAYHPDGHHSKIFQSHMDSRTSLYLIGAKASSSKNNALPYTTSTQLLELESRQSHFRQHTEPDEQVDRNGRDDSSTALRMRMDKLGKLV